MLNIFFFFEKQGLLFLMEKIVLLIISVDLILTKWNWKYISFGPCTMDFGQGNNACLDYQGNKLVTT